MFLYFGFLVAAWLGYKVWQLEDWQPHNVWVDLKPSSNSLKMASVLTVVEFWFVPGCTVQSFSFKKTVNRLPLLNLKLSITQFYSLKQVFFFFGGLGFILWIWFGTITVDKVFLYLCTWGLLMMLPEFYLLSVAKSQDRQVEREVPYFLDLLTLTLQSGSNLEQALFSTTKNYQSTLSLLLNHKLRELSWGRPLEHLLAELKIEIQNSDFAHFLDSVVRAKNLGVSLSETLVIQAEILRTRRRQKAETLSRTASVKISIPLVLFIFPALLIIYIGPGILQLLERT